MKTMTMKEREKHLAAIEGRRAILENAVVSVARGFTPALFVWGDPGLGKSHLLTVILDGVADAGWRHHTAHSTPRALVSSLHAEPGAIHLFEDCEKLLKTELSASILRAACGSPNDRDRWVTYETANDQIRFRMTGGIIIATNQNLSRTNGPLQGVASRFRPIKWDMTLEERIAVIQDLATRPAARGGVKLTAKECTAVAKRLVEMVGESRCDFELDIRLFCEHALPAFAQGKQNPGMSWEDLLIAKLTGAAQTSEEGQAERTRKMQQLAQAIAAEKMPAKEKIQKWTRLTDLNQAMYYRHLKNATKGM